MTHYETLGVPKSATKSELKSAYRGLVKKYHPDISKASDAKERIRQINLAYETLTDPYTRHIYDSGLEGIVIDKPQEETPAEKYRREYLHKKAHEEREKLEYLIKLKIKFYKVERKVCYFFLLIGALFSIDYYYQGGEKDFLAKSIEPSRHVTEVNLPHARFLAGEGLLKEHQQTGDLQLAVVYSAIFKIPTRVHLRNSPSTHRIFGNLHSFRNVFSIIIIGLSLIVVMEKNYSDVRLTCGLIPALLVIFIVLFAVTHPTF